MNLIKKFEFKPNLLITEPKICDLGCRVFLWSNKHIEICALPQIKFVPTRQQYYKHIYTTITFPQT